MENFTLMCINTRNFKQKHETVLKLGHHWNLAAWCWAIVSSHILRKQQRKHPTLQTLQLISTIFYRSLWNGLKILHYFPTAAVTNYQKLCSNNTSLLSYSSRGQKSKSVSLAWSQGVDRTGSTAGPRRGIHSLLLLACRNSWHSLTHGCIPPT